MNKVTGKEKARKLDRARRKTMLIRALNRALAAAEEEGAVGVIIVSTPGIVNPAPGIIFKTAHDDKSRRKPVREVNLDNHKERVMAAEVVAQEIVDIMSKRGGGET